VLSCKKRETIIYKLEELSTIKEVYGDPYYIEIFIVANPPKDNDKLQSIINYFNDSTLNQDISNKVCISRSRTFYRETKDLNKNFKEKDPNKSGYFEKVDLSDYYKDKLFQSVWSIDEKVVGYYTSYLESKIGETSHFVRDL